MWGPEIRPRAATRVVFAPAQRDAASGDPTQALKRNFFRKPLVTETSCRDDRPTTGAEHADEVRRMFNQPMRSPRFASALYRPCPRRGPY
jgi:transitional endoplasmic reticulum ATPase